LLTPSSISRLPAEFLSQPRIISLQIFIFWVSEVWQIFGGFGNVWEVALNCGCPSSIPLFILILILILILSAISPTAIVA
jgi:hypothetical protein